MKPSWGLVAALTILVASLFALTWGISLHTQPWKATAFAQSEVSRRGFDWPLADTTSDGSGDHRFLFQCPTDDNRYADMTIRFHAGAWSVVSFNEDFRPWQIPDATASR